MTITWPPIRLLDRPSFSNARAVDEAGLPAIYRMNAHGVRIDPAHFSRRYDELEADKLSLAEEIHRCVGIEINPASGDQCADLLFNQLQLHVRAGIRKPRLTASNSRYAAGKLEIEGLIPYHPVVSPIIGWREADKLQSSYAAKIPRIAVQHDNGCWYVHSDYRTTKVVSGRYSEFLMTLPKSKEDGIRAGFIASPGCVLVAVDASQIEMRVAAALAGCRRMLDCFSQPERLPGGAKNPLADIHTQTAMRVFGLPAEAIDEDEHRYPCKRVGFGVLYLIAAQGLQRQLNSRETQQAAIKRGKAPKFWTVEECDALIRGWYGENAEIRPFQELQFERARRYGMVWAWDGRIRYIPDIRSTIPRVCAEAERAAGNTPVQCGAMTVIKCAMGALRNHNGTGTFDRLERQGMVVRELLQTHDELLVETEPQHGEELAGIIVDHFAQAGVYLGAGVPIKAGSKVGESYGKM